jgi:protein-L-isoaspartate(D-aspartate) O-methyltransferase
MSPAERMVREQIEQRGVSDPRVLAAMRTVPRDEFVPEVSRDQAWDDTALPIGHGQTISQPFIVAFMTEALAPEPHHRVLEIGTGCGYQAAVLSLLVQEVFTIEIVPGLAGEAAQRLARLGFENIHVRCGDGHRGWPEHAPFDAIIVACAPEEIPAALVEQLAEGGRMIIPVGGAGAQELVLLEKHDGMLSRQRVMQVRFVPMTGEVQ